MHSWPGAFYRNTLFLDCTDFGITHSRFFRVNSLKNFFDTVEPLKIVSFQIEIGIYNKI